jgi:predicted nuclease of predicted toxin-antitoxin system
MRLLANENIAPSIIRALRGSGHEVLSAKESMTGAADQAVLMRAVAEQRVLLTFDKDFGELAFRSRLPASCGVILLRMTPEGRERDIQRILAALLNRDDWAGAFWVIADRRIRKRPLPKPAP